jgi:hypothetical protein
MMRNARHADHGRERGDIVACLVGKRPAALHIAFVPSGSRVVGRQKAVWAEAIVHLAQIGRARQYIIARFVRIGAEMVAKPQFRIGLGHDRINPIAPFGDTVPLSPALSACMTARIQCAGTRNRCEASATYDAHRLYAVVKPVDVLFPAAATNEHDTQPSTMVVMRQADVPTRGKPAAVSRSFQGEVVGPRLKGRPIP